MAKTYSSWEYSQGPTLYIDSSGFRSIDENKNFVYYYLVTYGPVEYRRKVTDEKGASTYEYKYSFGDSSGSRKLLEECEFSGKDQVTKTVKHTVTEDGFKDTITKTFYIDANMNSNIQKNEQSTVNPFYKVETTDWKHDDNSGPRLHNKKHCFGWLTCTRTGYRSERRSYTYTEEVYGIVDWAWYNSLVQAGEDYTQYPIYNWYTVTRTSYYYVDVPYSYSQLHNSYCTLDLNKIRNKIGRYSQYSAITFKIKTEKALNKPPKLFMDTSTSSTSLRTELVPKNSGSAGAGEIIEYYLPLNVVLETFKGYSTVKIIVQKGNCSSADGYISEAYAFVEIETDNIPYLNLVVQAYDGTQQKWFDVCTIPYLNDVEIANLRSKKDQVSKNLFLPTDLPKTDSTYRIQLDTNMLAKDYEMFTNFRIDVLSKQLIPPGSIEDRKICINNDTKEFDYEIEIDNVDEFRLNALGYETYETKTHPGFLQKGANDIVAYLKQASNISTDGIPEENVSKNNWYNYIVKKNGNWVSNNLFAANSFDFSEISILSSGDKFKDVLLSFKIPYRNLKPYSTYTLKFDINAKQAFMISSLNTINAGDENKVLRSKVLVESDYDSSKVNVQSQEIVLYSPKYKLKDGSLTVNVDEFNLCDRDINMEVVIETKDIFSSDSEYMTVSIVRNAVKNLFIKGVHCLCVDNNNEKYIDIIEPYNISTSGREQETHATIYYDGFHIEHINPLLYNNMVYLREELNKIRAQYELPSYAWSNWMDQFDEKGEVLVDEWGNKYSVDKDQPLRAIHFNEVKACCIDTYDKLLKLRPPVALNTSPSMIRNEANLIPLDESDHDQGYILQHVQDINGEPLDIDKYFPEWRKIIDLINRN